MTKEVEFPCHTGWKGHCNNPGQRQIHLAKMTTDRDKNVDEKEIVKVIINCCPSLQWRDRIDGKLGFFSWICTISLLKFTTTKKNIFRLA